MFFLFQDIDPKAIEKSAKDLTLEILDAGFLTLQEEMDKPNASYDSAITIVLEVSA